MDKCCRSRCVREYSSRAAVSTGMISIHSLREHSINGSARVLDQRVSAGTLISRSGVYRSDLDTLAARVLDQRVSAGARPAGVCGCSISGCLREHSSRAAVSTGVISIHSLREHSISGVDASA